MEKKEREKGGKKMKAVVLLLALILLLSGCPEEKTISFSDGKGKVDLAWTEAGIAEQELTEMRETDFSAQPKAGAWNEKLKAVETALDLFKGSLSQYKRDTELVALEEYIQVNLLLVSYLGEKNSLVAMNPVEKMQTIKAGLESDSLDSAEFSSALESIPSMGAQGRKAELAGLQLGQSVVSFKASHSQQIGDRFNAGVEKVSETVSSLDKLLFLKEAVGLELKTREWLSSFEGILEGGADCSKLAGISELVAEAESIALSQGALAEKYSGELKEKSVELNESLFQLRSIEAQLGQACG